MGADREKTMHQRHSAEVNGGRLELAGKIVAASSELTPLMTIQFVVF